MKERPEAENLLNIYAALAEQDRDTVIAQFAGQQFSGFKTALADLTVAKLAPIKPGNAPPVGRSRPRSTAS